MLVHIKLFSRFRELLPRDARGEADIDLPPKTTVEQLLDHLGVTGTVKLIDVNGTRETDRACLLREGDTVRIFPFVVGG